MKVTYTFDLNDTENYGTEKGLMQLHAQAEDMYHAVWSLFYEILRPIYKYDSWPVCVNHSHFQWYEGITRETSPSEVSGDIVAEIIKSAFYEYLSENNISTELLE